MRSSHRRSFYASHDGRNLREFSYRLSRAQPSCSPWYSGRIRSTCLPANIQLQRKGLSNDFKKDESPSKRKVTISRSALCKAVCKKSNRPGANIKKVWRIERTLIVCAPMRRATCPLCPRDHRPQPLDNSRNSAQLPLYLAAGRVLSNPPIIIVPERSQTRHSHLIALRSVINTSNTARTVPQQLPIR